MDDKMNYEYQKFLLWHSAINFYATHEQNSYGKKKKKIPQRISPTEKLKSVNQIIR